MWTEVGPGVRVCTVEGRPAAVNARPAGEPFPERSRVVWEEIVRTGFSPEELRRVRAPALVLHGRNDDVVPFEYGEELSETLPNAELVVFERSGHTPLERWEPDKFRAVVERFLATHGAAPRR